ncbi:MAG TPA: LysR substrate-binding domain-containing protein [Xanthomonadaceae bacterium]|nr:LysR substrate-binding domain-containing protein [Xanthomonadaceae bacterium]
MTPDGARLHEAVAAHFDAIERALRPGVSRRDDVLTLSLLPSLASSWLVPRLPQFLAKYPQLEFNLQSVVELVDFARDTAVDAALRYGPGQWPGMTAVHLFDDWITPVASPSLIAAHGGPRKSFDLAGYPLLGDHGGRWTEWFTSFGGTAPTKYVAMFNDTETLHRAATAGMGVAMGRMTLARPLIEAGLLITLSPHHLKSEYSHYLVYPARSNDHAGLLAFRDWVVAQARVYAATVAAETGSMGKGKRPPKKARAE